MTSGHFYFIKDSFYEQLPDCKLMTNKGNDLEGVHGRSCHFCFEYENYYWMVPISSRIEKWALGIRCGFSLPLNHKFIPKNRNSVVQYI